jgi:hypothetical protein
MVACISKKEAENENYSEFPQLLSQSIYIFASYKYVIL